MEKESDNFPWSWHLQGIILYKQEHIKHRINPFEFEAHEQEWEKNNAGLVFAQRQLDQELHETQQKLGKTQVERRK